MADANEPEDERVNLNAHLMRHQLFGVEIMPRFEASHFRSTEEYKTAAETFAVPTGRFLFDFGDSPGNVKNQIIKNFIARTVKSIRTLVESSGQWFRRLQAHLHENCEDGAGDQVQRTSLERPVRDRLHRKSFAT
jgi:hypothetical protein